MHTKKTAVFSHILPPSPSGQAVVLFNLLKELPPDNYVLISTRNYGKSFDRFQATQKLPGKYCFIPPLTYYAQKLFDEKTGVGRSFPIPGALLFPDLVFRALCLSRLIHRENISLVVACSGDVLNLPSAKLASILTKTELIPYLFDDYMLQSDNSKIRFFAKHLEPWVFRKLRKAIVPNEFLQEEYFRRYDIQSIVIRNPNNLGKNLHEFPSKTPFFSSNEFHIVFTGDVYHAHYDAFTGLVGALREMKQPARLHIFTGRDHLSLAGHGIAGEHVSIHSHIPQAMIPEILANANALYLPLAFRTQIPEVIRTSSPGKTGEFLASGTPTIVHAPSDSFISWFFRKHACGLVVNTVKSDAIARNIESFISDSARQKVFAQNGRMVAEREFSLSQIQAKFRKLCFHR